MADLDLINQYLQAELDRRNLASVSAVDAAAWLHEAGLLKDSGGRPGLPLRNLLRDKQILGQRQESNSRWFIDRAHDEVGGTAWSLKPGDKILRKDLSAQYGGNPEAGIAPSAKTPNLFVFSDPTTGQKYGYHDHWDGEVLHYYGMGRYGPQTMEGSNKALLEHESAGRVIRVFQGVGGEVTYLGEFRLTQDEPFYWDQARDFESETLRDVIVFRLERADPSSASTSLIQGKAGRPSYKRASEGNKSAPPKGQVRDPDAMDRATNAHSVLQNTLEAHARSNGGKTFSPGTLDPQFDLAWEKDNVLYLAEVKSLTAANEASQLRLGLGQLLHYKFLLNDGTTHVKAILFVEHEPASQAWVGLCSQYEVTLLWPEILATSF